MSPNVGTARPSHPLVSVCIPVYNGEAFIDECIGSVLEQTLDRFELLIVDNCSTDGTAEIIAGLGDSRIRYVRNEVNIGSIANFNRCIELATGELFLLLPHDDVLHPGCLATFATVFADHTDVGLAYSAFHTIDGPGDRLGSVANHLEDKLLSGADAIRDVVDHFHPIQLPMARTSILRSLGGFDGAFAGFSDIHLWMRIVFEGWCAYYVCESLSSHRVHDDQGQHFFKQNTAENMRKLSEHYGRTLDLEFFSDNNYNQAFFNFIRCFVFEIRTHGYDPEQPKRVLSKNLVRSQIRNLLLSVINANGFMCRREVTLLLSLARWGGYGSVCRWYVEVALEEMGRRVSRLVGFRRDMLRSTIG
ncbi:MAG: glycosyltransferase [Chloroflexi bacterium]|nr:glycosyltransferase [Chloroflexota bacterium]